MLGARVGDEARSVPHKLELFRYKRVPKAHYRSRMESGETAESIGSKADLRTSAYVQTEGGFTQELFHKEQGLKELRELSAEIRHNTHNYKRAWVHFWLMLAEVMLILLRLIRDIVMAVLKIVVLILVLILRIIATVLLALYFLVVMFLPTRRNSPFRNTPSYERIRRRDYTVRKQRVLFLDLDNTLVAITPHKPAGRECDRLKVRAAGGEAFEVYYCVKRPFLNEFLLEVS